MTNMVRHGKVSKGKLRSDKIIQSKDKMGMIE